MVGQTRYFYVGRASVCTRLVTNPNCPHSYVTNDTRRIKIGLAKDSALKRYMDGEGDGVWWDKPGWEEYFAALERSDGKGDPNCLKGHVATFKIVHGL